MISFVKLPATIQGTIGLIIVFLLLAAVINIILGISHRYLKNVFGLSLMIVVLFVMFQIICDICSHMSTSISFLNKLEHYFEQIPAIFIVLFLVIIAVIEVVIYNQNHAWKKQNITPFFIKEAIDNLPVGICCYESNGQVMMVNKLMEEICLEQTGEALLNAVSFRNTLYKEDNYKEKDVIIKVNNDKVYSIADSIFSDEESQLRIMTATNITEQYKNTIRLKEQQELVVKLNKELSEYGKQIVSSITAKEVLNAKVKLHDELGANLLAIKRYILNGGAIEERIAIENILRNNLQYLKNETVAKEKDEYAIILETAEKLGVKVRVVGELTELEPQRHVIVTGIHECLTNAIRHAGGDELTVVLSEEDNYISAGFTNNGKAPLKEIKETGGLALLRALTEENGGMMQIISMPEFELTIKMPKETRYVI